MALILTDEQECDLSVEFKTAAGNAGRVDGIPVWSVSNPSVVTVTVAADGRTAVVSSASLGETQVSVVADADLGEGVRQITGVLDVTVQAAEVVVVGVVAGTPRVKTPV